MRVGRKQKKTHQRKIMTQENDRKQKAREKDKILEATTIYTAEQDKPEEPHCETNKAVWIFVYFHGSCGLCDLCGLTASYSGLLRQ